MPPKKGSSKKPEKPRTPILIDGLTKDEISKEQLEDHIMRLREELDREREERNYFQLERDKVQAFWDITQRKLKEATAELKNLDKDLEETEIKLQVETKVYRQKMRHLLCEHQNTICELKADRIASKETMQAVQTELENGLRSEVALLLADLHLVDSTTPILEFKKKHEQEMANLKVISEKKLQDFEAKNEKACCELQLDLQNQRKKVVSEDRDNWTRVISNLVEKDTATYEHAKAFFKTREKLFEVNIELKQNVTDESATLRQKEKEWSQTLQDNQQLTENLSKVQEEIAQLQNKMKYKPKKFDNSKDIELNNLAREHEMLQKRLQELQMEEAELRKTSGETLEMMQIKADAKHMQIENKIQHLADKIQKNLLIPKH